MTEPPQHPRFLYKHTVLDIHEDQIAEHGGDPGVRDEGLLESALAQPMARFGGEYLHEDLFAMAAALVFLDANGYEVADEGADLADVVIELVERKRDKAWAADQLRQRARRIPGFRL